MATLRGIGFTELFVVFIMVVIILLYLKRHYGEVEFVKSSVDGRSYLVRALPTRREAADRLARLNITLTRLVQHMVAAYPDDEAVKRLYANYNPEALSEGGSEVGYTSYSVNKGERIVMCIRQPDGAFVAPNLVLYVAVHELGHLMCDEIGHTGGFWGHFKRLLQEAVKIGLYTPEDYAANPRPYCGITISSSII